MRWIRELTAVAQGSVVIGLASMGVWGHPGSWAQAEPLPQLPSQSGRHRAQAEGNTPSPSLQDRKAVAEYVRLGNRKYAAADYEEAIAAYSQALSLFPPHAYALYHRGNAYRKQKNYGAAIADYNQSLRLNPDNTFGYFYRGMALQEVGQLEAAVADYTLCIQRNDKNPVMFHRRGEAYHGLGKQKRAIADLQKAAKLYQSQKKYRQQSQVNRQLKKVKAAR